MRRAPFYWAEKRGSLAWINSGGGASELARKGLNLSSIFPNPCKSDSLPKAQPNEKT